MTGTCHHKYAAKNTLIGMISEQKRVLQRLLRLVNCLVSDEPHDLEAIVNELYDLQLILLQMVYELLEMGI